VAFGASGVQDFALADQFGGEFGGAAVLAGGAAQYQSVASVLDYSFGDTFAVSAGHLGDRLESEDAAATELAQARERVLEAINCAEGVQLVYDEPQALVSFVVIHGLEDPESHPGRDHRGQGSYLTCPVRNEEDATVASILSCSTIPYPLADR